MERVFVCLGQLRIAASLPRTCQASDSVPTGSAEQRRPSGTQVVGLCRRGRVAVGSETEDGLPKSRRSRRDLPPPPELAEALRALKTCQKAEALALGVVWSDDRLIAVHEDSTPVRHEWYSDEFQRLRERAGLRASPQRCAPGCPTRA